ncbi:MAG: hypothetical protein L0387_24410 [Acidobacteria bacterium]|nr:hypothetical protein [Acidobacteriota bacterium]MCI0720249.1 hypothetical protein [Acidobacteriota bacterium]
MTNLKRIAITSCAASVLFGAVGTLNIPLNSVGTSVLLARSDKEQNSYNRGYQQGRQDARTQRRADFSRRWDSDFRRGYEDGYNQEFRRRNRSRNDGYYDRAGSDPYYGSRNDGYYGRNDGYYGRNDGYYGRSGSDTYYSGPGRMLWRGRVDDYVELRVQGNRVRSIERGGAPTYNEQASFSSPLPRADVRVDIRKRDGRGRVSVLEHPNRLNNYTAVIRIDDNKGGADDYEIEMEWR